MRSDFRDDAVPQAFPKLTKFAKRTTGERADMKPHVGQKRRSHNRKKRGLNARVCVFPFIDLRKPSPEGGEKGKEYRG